MMMMMTRQHTSTVLSAAVIAETLEKYDIAPNQLNEWEVALGLSIPTSPQGEKVYSSQHLNLFKNVKKHLTLGRNLKQIKQLIQLPASNHSVAVQIEPPAIVVQEAPVEIEETYQSHPMTEENIVPKVAPISTNFKNAWGNSPSYTKDKLVFLELIELPEEAQAAEPTLQTLPPVAEQPTVAPATPLRTAFAASAEALVEVSTVDQQITTDLTKLPSIPSNPTTNTLTTSTLSMDAPIQLTAQEAPPSAIMASQNNTVGGAILPIPNGSTALNNATTMQIVERLMGEKEANQRKLIEAEKLNSHLYNVNNLFNKKVKELTQMVQQLKTVANEQQNMKLMEEKAVLQRQLLDVERNKLEQQRAFSQEQQKASLLARQLENVQQQWQELTTGFNPKRFVGHWQETLLLKQKVFDTFGLNVEPQRNQHRVFEIAPTRVAGNAGFFSFEFKYPDNTVWKRLEQLSLVSISPDELVGEVSVDYVLDGVIVCRAIYQASLQRVQSLG
ncbi:MAG: MerR family transcriptional regulator [Vampirovibrio sp.]|nr:MerR family transcriptional regulator [Vampirovibrio sp.]